MTNPCLEKEQQLSMLISGDLPPETRKELDQHLGQCPACRAYVEALREDDRVLGEMTAHMAPAVGRVEGAVLQALKQERRTKAEPEPERRIPSWTRLFGNRWTQFAVAASIVFVALTAILVGGPKPTHAKVLGALEKARTAHITVKAQQDGQWQTGAELWYERGVGVLEQEDAHGKLRKRLDDGVSQWTYRGGSPWVMKAKSTDPNAQGALARVLNLQEWRGRFLNKPVGKKTVGGIECTVYSEPGPDNTWRMDIWLDRQLLVRRWEKLRRTESGEWQVYEIAAAEYDRPIDRGRLAPDFGPGVTVIEGDKFWEKRFALDRALFTKEVLGQLYAVHEVKRCDDGSIFLLSSLRPTTATLRELGPIDSSTHGLLAYGDFNLLSSWERLPDGKERSYQPWTLASVQHNGIEVQWNLLIPRGPWPENQCKLGVYIHARSKLEEKFKKAGVEPYQQVRPMAVLPLPEKKVALNELIASVYNELLQLEPVVCRANLFRASKPDPKDPKRSTVSLVRPSTLLRGEYESECQAELRHLKNR